jgi:hypothetical protein
MKEFVDITKKYGVTGVLACWLWITNSRVEVLEAKLEHCYELRMANGNLKANRMYSKSINFAILPDKFKIKKG